MLQLHITISRIVLSHDEWPSTSSKFNEPDIFCPRTSLRIGPTDLPTPRPNAFSSKLQQECYLYFKMLCMPPLQSPKANKRLYFETRWYWNIFHHLFLYDNSQVSHAKKFATLQFVNETFCRVPAAINLAHPLGL